MFLMRSKNGKLPDHSAVKTQRVSRGWIRSNTGFSVSRVSNCELVSARKPWKIKSGRRKEKKLDVVLKNLSVHGTNAGRQG